MWRSKTKNCEVTNFAHRGFKNEKRSVTKMVKTYLFRWAPKTKLLGLVLFWLVQQTGKLLVVQTSLFDFVPWVGFRIFTLGGRSPGGWCRLNE